MTHRRFSFTLIVIVVVAVCLFQSKSASAKSWDFESWKSDITVLSDSTILVKEVQQFNLTDDFSWVTRTLPKTKGIWFDQINVTDAGGQPLTDASFTVKESGSDVTITVSFSKTEISRTTRKTFTFNYRALNALGDFSDYDELYWNAVSSDRTVTIKQAEATVHLPGSYESSQLRQKLFIGPTDSLTESNDFAEIDGATLKFSGAEILPGDNLTIVAGWPKGDVTFTNFEQPKTTWQKIWGWLRWPYYLSPLFLLVWLWSIWRKSGKDSKGRGTIIAQYDPPDAAPPAIVGTLIDERFDQKDLSATLIDLAVRGYLKIVEEKDSGLFRQTTYTFVRLKSFANDVSLKEFERLTLEALFQARNEVKLSELKNKFYKDLKKIKQSVYEETVKLGYFATNPEKIRQRYFIAAAVIGWLGFFGLFVFFGWAVLLVIFGAVMPKRTARGVAAKEWAEGFKLYLHTAERFRVAAMTPQTFERFLPYAMIFKVERQWAERFADIAKQPPAWFSTNDPNFHFSSVIFASHLTSAMNASVSRSLAASPSSSSGFSGGGFSGGGGGGGGSGAG